MDMRPYSHIERLTMSPTTELTGLLQGDVWVFPKLDGACHSVWFDPDSGEARCSSRTQILSKENDGTRFHAYFEAHPELGEFVKEHPNLTIYGEFLTPHTVKAYEDEAWNEFYVFDVYDADTDSYLPYDTYMPIMAQVPVRVIPPLSQFKDPTYDEVRATVNHNTYLMRSGCVGEGVVVKNYGYRNPYGRSTWGKIVIAPIHGNVFEAIGARPAGQASLKDELPDAETRLLGTFLSKEFISKEFHKFTDDRGLGWSNSMIPDFIRYVWQEWWKDYSFEAIGNSKGTYDMKRLRSAFSGFVMNFIHSL